MISRAAKIQQRNLKNLLLLFIGMLTFKASLDLSYWIILTRDTVTYQADFSPLKYALGLGWCVVLFFGIRHTERKVSSFLLYLVYLFQIIPITTIYSLGNDSSAYYNVLCIGFFLCELIVGFTWNLSLLKRNSFITKALNVSFAVLSVGLILIIIYKNGVPSLTALNLYDVYELRGSGSFQLGGYLNYLLVWLMSVFLPVGLTVSILKKKYILSAALCGTIFLIYLYSGHKTYLFSIPLILVGVIWAQRKNFYNEIFVVGSLGASALSFLSCVTAEGGLINKIYSLIIRRTMFVSANNKFKYFDYFTQHPKMGIYGIFPRWMIDVDSYYETVDYTYDISAIYFNKPEMNSNTGFLAEGFMRFGHIGTILVLVVFALLLKQADKLQDRMGYAFAAGLLIYPVFSLNDAHLLDSFILGTWMILMVILMFYTNTPTQGRRRLGYERTL